MLAAIGFTRGVKLLAVLGLGAVLVGFASLCVFTVGGGEFAVVTQFGRPVRVESTPGLKLKLPAPFQTVARFDRRLFALVPTPREFLTLGKKNVIASGFILWRVHDPKKFMQTVFDRVGAESRLGDILFAELGAALGGAPFPAFVSTAPGEYRAEAILAGVTRQYREIAWRDYGIDVVDVRLRRLDFPEQNRASVFARMKSERIRISMQYRSGGENLRREPHPGAELLPVRPLDRRHEEDRRQGDDHGAAGGLRAVPAPSGQPVPLPGALISGGRGRGRGGERGAVVARGS